MRTCKWEGGGDEGEEEMRGRRGRGYHLLSSLVTDDGLP